jgi:hypothetical protein
MLPVVKAVTCKTTEKNFKPKIPPRFYCEAKRVMLLDNLRVYVDKMETIVHSENLLLYDCFSHSVFKRLKRRITWKPYTPLYCSDNTADSSRYLKTFRDFTAVITKRPLSFEIEQNRLVISITIDQYIRYINQHIDRNTQLVNGYVSLIKANDRGVARPLGLPLLSTSKPQKSKKSKPLLESLERTIATAHLKTIRKKRIKLMEELNDASENLKLLSRHFKQYKVMTQAAVEEI